MDQDERPVTDERLRSAQDVPAHLLKRLDTRGLLLVSGQIDGYPAGKPIPEPLVRDGLGHAIKVRLRRRRRERFVAPVEPEQPEELLARAFFR